MKSHVARTLRKNQTPWENRLWQVVRNRNLKNAKFRRQFFIPPYGVDFICLEAKLIVELDGSQHAAADKRLNDQTRQSFSEKQGYTVLRFWNIDIDKNIDSVVARISEYL